VIPQLNRYPVLNPRTGFFVFIHYVTKLYNKGIPIMTPSNFDYLLNPVETCSTEPKGYEWKVVQDPTRNGEEPGLFYGRLFRMIDIRLERDEHSTWPDGIIFQHINTRERLAFQYGLLIDIDNAMIIHKNKRQQSELKKKQKVQVKKKIEVDTDVDQFANRKMKRFVLIRTEDLIGVSGTGEVAEGVVFRSGMAALHWLREPYSIGIYQDIDDIIRIHGHEGKTQLQFIN
jgi:hypothetical protein